MSLSLYFIYYQGRNTVELCLYKNKANQLERNNWVKHLRLHTGSGLSEVSFDIGCVLMLS